MSESVNRGRALYSIAPGIGFRQLLPPVHWSTLLRRTFMLISSMKKEEWRRREEYFLGVDLEDVKDL